MTQMMFNSNPIQYEMFQYSNNSPSFYTPQPTRIPVEYTGSSTLDERDRRRRRSGSASTSSKDKESIPNMHLVGGMQAPGGAATLMTISADEHRIELRREHFASARRSTSKA